MQVPYEAWHECDRHPLNNTGVNNRWWAKGARCSSLDALSNSESLIVGYVLNIIYNYILWHDIADCLSIQPSESLCDWNGDDLCIHIFSNISSADVLELSDRNITYRWIRQLLVWTFLVVLLTVRFTIWNSYRPVFCHAYAGRIWLPVRSDL